MTRKRWVRDDETNDGSRPEMALDRLRARRSTGFPPRRLSLRCCEPDVFTDRPVKIAALSIIVLIWVARE